MVQKKTGRGGDGCTASLEEGACHMLQAGLDHMKVSSDIREETQKP